MKTLIFGLVLCAVTTASAQTFPPTLVEKAGCVLKASAYIDSSHRPDWENNPSGRFDLQLFQSAYDQFHWDFILPNDPTDPGTNVSSSFNIPNSKSQRRATIRATLRQFDACDETITFKNLDLMPISSLSQGWPSRFLKLKAAQSITTPSGITVTLPAQSESFMTMFGGNFNGNADVLFVRADVKPNTHIAPPLPLSPLFRRHGRNVKIKLEVTSTQLPYLANFTASHPSSIIAVDLPNLKTATHLDELTLIVHQRADLQTIPISFQVPISKPKPAKRKGK